MWFPCPFPCTAVCLHTLGPSMCRGALNEQRGLFLGSENPEPDPGSSRNCFPCTAECLHTLGCRMCRGALNEQRGLFLGSENPVPDPGPRIPSRNCFPCTAVCPHTLGLSMCRGAHDEHRGALHPTESFFGGLKTQCQIQDPEFPLGTSRNCFPCTAECLHTLAHRMCRGALNEHREGFSWGLKTQCQVQDPEFPAGIVFHAHFHAEQRLREHQGSSGCPGPQQSPGDVPTEPQGCPQGSTGMAQLCPQAMQVPRWGQRRGDSTPEVSPAEPQAAPTAGANPACPSSLWLSQPWGQSLQPLCLQKRFQATPLPFPGCPRAGQREEPAGFGLRPAML
ncbi:uncharacterized protein LOC122149454 [Catharus ustulatus]|uniref:uncharacterized protein LOC122149454 n=1 Tax=Catharus ustulatus TaxID=91951 RepID=UPI001C5AEDD6|nr:uncharacterized protein LOC122149454 [Catharus ustulatus]